MFSWASSLWNGFTSAASAVYDYGKSAASYLVDNAQGVGTLLAGGAALYGAMNQPDPPAMPKMPTINVSSPPLPTADSTAAFNDLSKKLAAPAPLVLSDGFKSILDQGADAKAKFKKENSIDTTKIAADAKKKFKLDAAGSGDSGVASDTTKIAADTKKKFKLGPVSSGDSGVASANTKARKREKAIRADVKTDTTVWDSYAPISFKTLLGGTS